MFAINTLFALLDAIALLTSSTSKQDITEVLESVTKSVVGISKIKNKGNSIFLNNSASDLGLGTGMVVSENGYILTNWHVAGNKYGWCNYTGQFKSVKVSKNNIEIKT